jgi:hypothetical protein
LQDPPKITKSGIFGLKICHLATLQVAQRTNDFQTENVKMLDVSGLPDFSRYMIPKPEKCTK